MHPIEAFVRSPVKVAVGVLMVCMFGVIAWWRMPMQLTPEVQIPTISIETVWPGASPQEIEREIIQEQEEQLKGVEGVTKMTSECRDSAGTITMEFAVGANMQEAILLVNSRLQQVPEYPEDADQPVISTSSSSNSPIAWFVLGTKMADEEKFRAVQKEHPELADDLEKILKTKNPGLAVRRLRTFAKEHPEAKPLLPPDTDVDTLRRFCEDTIEAQFERVEGVANSNVIGGRDPEMQVVVDPRQLAARQLTIQHVRNALRGQNADTSAGDFWEGKRRYVVRTLGQFRSPEQVEDTLLAVVNNAPVYVRDVAEVRLSFKKPDGFVRRYGDNCIAVNCLRETGANVIDIMEGLKKETARLNRDVLHKQGLVLTQVYDETEYIISARNLVRDNIFVGGALTVLVLLVFLRDWRSTLVIGLAIPISIIGTFLILAMLGRSLNVISLAGLSFAVGMLVDNSVVVLENIFRYYQMGDRPWTAAIKGAREVWMAVVSSTLTTLAVFIPVVFMEEEAGQLFRDIALAIGGAVGLSLIVSVVVVPLGASRILKDHGADEEALERARRSSFMGKVMRPFDGFGARFVEMVVGINRWALQGTARQLALVLILMGASFGLTYFLWPPVEYLPGGNRNLVFGIALPPPGYNLDTLAEIGTRVETHLEPYWNIDPDDPRAKDLDFPPIEDFFYVARGRQVFLGLRSAEPMRARELIPLIMQLQTEIPGTFVVAKQSSLFEQGLTAGRTVDVEITGPELERLVQIGGQVMGQVMMGGGPDKPPVIPNGMAFPKPSLDLSSPEVHVSAIPVKADELKITNSELGYAVNALVDGAYATDYFPNGQNVAATLDDGRVQITPVGTKKIDLVIIGSGEFAERMQDLADLPVATPDGQLVTLADVANVRLSSGPEQINHRERQRAITIEVTPPPDMSLDDAIARIDEQIRQPLLADGKLADAGITINLRGTADKLAQTWNALKWNLLLAVLITYLLMAALFESWVYPFVVIVSVPLGAVGGVILLQLLSLTMVLQGQPPQMLDVITMLGFIILIGTVVNNAILIVEQTLHHMRNEGMERQDAILESVRNRIRPIFMTTTTTVFGLLPLVLFPGAGSELYRGLGAVVLGGLVVSTIFTLVLIPTLFNLMSIATAGRADHAVREAPLEDEVLVAETTKV